MEIKQAAAGYGIDELMHEGFTADETGQYRTEWFGRNAQRRWEVKPIDAQQHELPYLLITVSYLVFVTKTSVVLKAVLALLKEAYSGFDDVYAAGDLDRLYATTRAFQTHLLIFAKPGRYNIAPMEFAGQHNPFKHNNNMFDEKTWNVQIADLDTSSPIWVKYSLTRL